MHLVFRARRTALLKAAKARGIADNPHAIAIALDLPYETVRSALNGGHPSASTVLALCHGLRIPVEDGFRVIEKPE